MLRAMILGVSFAALAAGCQTAPADTAPAATAAKPAVAIEVSKRVGANLIETVDQVKAVTEQGIDPRNFILCTDDCHSGTLVHDGHMNRVVRHAIACGCDPLIAIQMATINTATHFGLERELGSITPGRRADVILTGAAIYEAVLAMMESLITEYDKTGYIRERTGAILPNVAPSNVYKTADGLVLIAPAPDFTSELIEPSLTEAERQSLAERGYFEEPSEYSPEPNIFTRALMEDGNENRVLTGLIETGCPVHILQGMKDPDVPYQHALKLMEFLPLDDVVLTLIRDGDHRLSRPQDIALLEATLAELAGSGP